ncbi:MAG: hypothetical protein ACRD1Z_19380, partial [Vicinamibacteria bacterium]
MKRLSALAALAMLASPLAAQTAREATGEAAVAPQARTPAPEARTYTLPPEQYEKAVAYSRAKYRLHFVATAWEVAILIALIAMRVAPRFRDLAERASRKRFVQALVFVPLLVAAVEILELPIGIYRHQLSLAYEQSVQG